MTPARIALPLSLALLAAGPAAADTEDRAFIDVAIHSLGPGIPLEGEGLALGTSVVALIQEDEGDFVWYVRPGLTYARTIDGWGDDPRTFDLAGLTASVGFGIPDLGPVIPYVEIGLDPVGGWSLSPVAVWDWGLGLHASLGAMFELGRWFTLRPAVGWASYLFTDLDRPLGGLWCTVAFGFDLDPPDGGDGDDGPQDDFRISSSTIYPSPGQPGGASLVVSRASGFTDPVDLWAEPPAGVVAIVLPDPTGGPDHWRLLVTAPAGQCGEQSILVRARSGDVEKSQSVWVAPSCSEGGAP
ncbi:MAG: hypothetical protein GYA57_00395 [Myxococcales bacterium]|nr:hypothetical protein [Myxococcales bacterium]